LEVGRELLEGGGRRVDLGPEIGSEETVGSGNGSVSGLDEVTHSGSVSSGLGVAILNTSELKHTLASGGSDDTSSSGTGDHGDGNGTSLTGNLARYGVGLSKLVTPVSTTNGDD